MQVLHTSKNYWVKTPIIDNSENLLKTWTKVAVFKTLDWDIEALTFLAQDYYWDIISSEVSQEKEFIASWVINTRESKKSIIETNRVTQIADKRFSNTSLSKEEIESIMTEVNIAVSNIIWK